MPIVDFVDIVNAWSVGDVVHFVDIENMMNICFIGVVEVMDIIGVDVSLFLFHQGFQTFSCTISGVGECVLAKNKKFVRGFMCRLLLGPYEFLVLRKDRFTSARYCAAECFEPLNGSCKHCIYCECCGYCKRCK